MTHKRKPGGQPGNQNARKHGFYSTALTPAQQVMLAPAKELSGLDEEIAVARLKLKPIIINAPQNYNVTTEALATLARLVGEKRRLSKNNSRRFFNALEIVLGDISSFSKDTRQRRSKSDSGAVSPPSLVNDSCVI